jgi:hypothetical protein
LLLIEKTHFIDFLHPNPLPFPEIFSTRQGVVVKGTDKNGLPLC